MRFALRKNQCMYIMALGNGGEKLRIQSIGKDQKSLDRAGKSMSGSDVVIAPEHSGADGE